MSMPSLILTSVLFLSLLHCCCLSDSYPQVLTDPQTRRDLNQAADSDLSIVNVANTLRILVVVTIYCSLSSVSVVQPVESQTYWLCLLFTKTPSGSFGLSLLHTCPLFCSSGTYLLFPIHHSWESLISMKHQNRKAFHYQYQL